MHTSDTWHICHIIGIYRHFDILAIFLHSAQLLVALCVGYAPMLFSMRSFVYVFILYAFYLLLDYYMAQWIYGQSMDHVALYLDGGGHQHFEGVSRYSDQPPS